MTALEQIRIFLTIAAWVAMWWLAVRIVFGRFLAFFEGFDWVLVALFAFFVPMILADYDAVSENRFAEQWALAAWDGLGLVIDGVWCVWRIRRWVVRRRAAKSAQSIVQLTPFLPVHSQNSLCVLSRQLKWGEASQRAIVRRSGG